MKRIAIFASGSGSNAQNIISFFKKDETACVPLILSNNPNAFVLERAKSLGVATFVFDKKELLSESGVLKTLQTFKIDSIVLAGFLWKFPKILLTHFRGRVINIHPALLPKYGGKGMYGMNIHTQVVANNEKETGITIHEVNEHYDKGAVIFQIKCRLDSMESAESLAKKIHILEMQHFPRVIKDFIVKNG